MDEGEASVIQAQEPPSFPRLFRDVFIYGGSDVVLKAVGFLTLPIYTRIFTPGQFGVLSFVLTLLGFLGGILVLGGDTAYARFFFEAKTMRERQIVTSTWFVFLAVWSAAVVVVSLVFTARISVWAFGTPRFRTLLALALLAAPVTLANAMCGQVLRNTFRPGRFAAFNALSAVLTVALGLIGAVGLDRGLEGILGGALTAALIMLPIRMWSARSMLRPAFSAHVLRKLLAFGVPLVPTSIAYWAFASSDRLVLAKLSTLHELGLYAVANGATGVLAVAVGGLGQAWVPHSIQVYEEHPGVAPSLFGRMLTYILAGFGLLSVGITAFAHEALVLLSTAPFYRAATAIGPLALAFMAWASTQVTSLGITLQKKTTHLALISVVAALLNLGLNLWLVPIWGMLASAWATTASYVFLTLAYLITSRRVYRVTYETRRAIAIVAGTVAFVVAAPLLPEIGLAGGFALKTSYCLAYVVVLFALGGVDRRERNALRRMWDGRRPPPAAP